MLLALSLGGSLVAGLMTLVEPSRKWTSLRSASLTIESEVWKFRTRMGEYGGDTQAFSTIGRADAERRATECLSRHLQRVQENVMGSGLKRTSFYSVATTAADTLEKAALGKESLKGMPPHLRNISYIRHGQFNVTEWKGETRFGRKTCPMASARPQDDNHHSPALPEDYIKARLVPMRDFYQRKIPGYYQRHRFYQCFILFASILSALIATTSVSAVNSVLATLASMVAAWQEFTTVEKKLERTSSVATSLENLLLWWQSVPMEEKKIISNIETLVMTTEGSIAGLSAATLAETSQATKKAVAEQQPKS